MDKTNIMDKTTVTITRGEISEPIVIQVPFGLLANITVSHDGEVDVSMKKPSIWETTRLLLESDGLPRVDINEALPYTPPDLIDDEGNTIVNRSQEEKQALLVQMENELAGYFQIDDDQTELINDVFNIIDINHKYLVTTEDKMHIRLEAVMVGTLRGITTDRHIETSCICTAGMIRWVLTGSGDHVDWCPVAWPTSHIYQVMIGEDWDDYQHIITVVGDIVYQSYWNEYNLQRKRVPDLDHVLKCINQPEMYTRLTGIVPKKDISNWKCFYYQS